MPTDMATAKTTGTSTTQDKEDAVQELMMHIFNQLNYTDTELKAIQARVGELANGLECVEGKIDELLILLKKYEAKSSSGN